MPNFSNRRRSDPGHNHSEIAVIYPSGHATMSVSDNRAGADVNVPGGPPT